LKDPVNKQPKTQEEQETDWDKHTRKWFNNLVELSNNAIRAADVTPFRRGDWDRLVKVVEPSMLETVRRGGEALLKLAEHLKSLEAVSEAKMAA
jgi:hypothetical protein